jgi:glycosyltransferase involved in cell wall biosynthesis
MRKSDLRHVHVHINGTAPFVALLATTFGNLVEPERRWTWSLTVHGPSEFYDVYGEQLAEKVRDASLVVCISDFARSQLMALVEEEHWGKLQIVHCGVDLESFPAVERSQNGRQDLRLLSVGRLVQVKGQAVLLEAVADLAQRDVPVSLTVIGNGPKRAALEELAGRLGIADRVTFAGAIGQDEILRYFEQADVFAMSSFAEGVPVVLMEAMATQLPVVSSQVMGIGELVLHERNGLLVRPARPDQLAAALERLVREPELRVELGRNGRRTVGEEFDVHRSAEQLRGLFAEHLDGQRAARNDPSRSLLMDAATGR